MARSKAPSKKQQSRGVDFKKIKRKVGRKLPPPKNATNTLIKSKAIILPEQSVASEKAGLAVSKKGLTLKELLQQTSHHNHKVRKDALVGIKELLHNFPAELKLHKLTVIDKLRERISDDDKVVRDTLYQLFKSVILPGCKEDNQGALISLLTAYIFNAMTHLSIDIRLMAFKFFDLIVQHYPTAFSSNAEKVLLNYVDILRTKQFHFHDKGKFKIALSGLMHCLSLLPSNGKEVDVCGKNIVEKPVLHAFEPDEPDDHPGYIPILGKLEELVIVLINCFDEIFPLLHSQKQIDYQSFDCLLSVLQSIDFAVQFLAYRIEKHEMDPYASFPSPVHSDSSVLAQNSFSVLLNKLFRVFPLRLADHLSAADSSRYFSLNLVISKIFFNFSEQICPQPVLPDQFLEFMEYVLIYQRNWSGKALYERNIVSQLTFIPKIVSKVDWIWKHRLLQAFTEAFTGCNPESIVKMACLSAAEEMLVSEELKMTDQQALGYQRAWISELPVLLISLGHSHPSCSEAVLRLLIHIGQLGLSSSDLAEEYDNIQNSLQGFYSIMSKDGDVCYGPFIRLPKELQELSICCLYYLPSLNYNLLASLASCCLCPTMEPLVLHRIVEVMHSAYKAERIWVADHISFFITLLSQYQVIPEKLAKVSSQTTFMSITSVICSLLSQMGDHSVVFQFLEKGVLDLMSLKLPLENTCALMRMLVVVDSRPTLLSEQSITQLSDVILGYLIDVALLFPEDSGSAINPATLRASHYYILPCLCFFDRCSKLLKLVLDKMSSFAIEFDPVKFFRDAEIAHDHLRRVRAIVSVFSMMCKDVKTRRSLSSCKDEIDHVMEALRSLQMSEGMNISIEHKHVIQCALDQLRILSCALPRPAS